MLVRSVVFVAVVSLLLVLSARELNSAPHPPQWGQRVKSFFDIRDTNTLDMLKKLGIGTAFVALVGSAALFGMHEIDNLVGSKIQSDVMLDTIIRFDDDIIGRTFHFTANARHYKGDVIEWNSPYDKMLLYSNYDNDHILVPVENLLGKAVPWHAHKYATVTFISPDHDNYLLRGKVLEVFDSDYYYIFAKSQVDRDGIVSPLDEPSLIFVPKKNMTSIEPPPMY